MKRILITGANSYIGTSVEQYLAQWPDQYQVDTIDMIDGSWREKSFAGYDSVFHVAGIAHIKTRKLDEKARETYWYVNAELPVKVAEKAKAQGVCQFVFLSSMSVYGEHGGVRKPTVVNRETDPHPKDIYGKSKLVAEEGLKQLETDDFKICVLRPPMIYGPKCKGNYQLLSKIAKTTPIFPKFPNQRSMLFIGNMCGFIKGCVDESSSGLFLPQNAQYVNTSDMVKAISDLYDRNVRFISIFNFLFCVFSFSTVRKVFGSLIIEKNCDDICDLYDFNTSISLTEKGGHDEIGI